MLAVATVLSTNFEVTIKFVVLGAKPVALYPLERTTSKLGASEGFGPTGDTEMELMGAPLTDFGQRAASKLVNNLLSRAELPLMLIMLTCITSTATVALS